MSATPSTTCLNCGQALQPDHRFCPACGQATHLHRIDGHYLAHEAVHYFTHADRGIFLLLASLLRQPGIAAKSTFRHSRFFCWVQLSWCL